MKLSGFFGKKMVKCSSCGEFRPWGEFCPTCDGEMDTFQPRWGELLRPDSYGIQRLIEESDIKRAGRRGQA